VATTATAEPAAPPPASFSGQLPADLEAVLQSHVRCEDEACRGRLYPPQTLPDDQTPAALWSQELTAGSLTFPTEPQLDLYGILFRGEAKLSGIMPGETGAHHLRPYQAFRAPGAAVKIEAVQPPASTSPVRIVFALVTDGQPVKAVLAKPSAAAPAQRPEAIALRDLQASPDLAWGDGAFHARLGFESGRASFGLLLASPTGGVPAHDHSESWEVLGLIRTGGVFKRGPEGATTDVQLTDGALVAVEPKLRHTFEPSGRREMLAVQLYVPPGPEQRFKQLAAASR